MQEGELEGIYMRAYTSYHVQTKPKRKKKQVAGKREVRIIAYTSKHKKQRATPSRIEEALIRPFLSLRQMNYDVMQRINFFFFESTEGLIRKR